MADYIPILDGLTVMISACHSNENERGRPGFDSLSGRFFVSLFFLLTVCPYTFFFFFAILAFDLERDLCIIILK